MLQEKSLPRIILNRIQTSLDKKLLEEQAGFRPRGSTIDQIFILKMVMKRAREFYQPLHMTLLIEKHFGEYVEHMDYQKR